MNHGKEIRTHLSSSVLPALFVGALSGTVAGCAVTLYKFCAKGAVSASSQLYRLMSDSLLWLLALIPIAFAFARLLAWVYGKEPDLQGGGIPASVGTLRGLFRFHPWKNAAGSFLLSLVSFVFGVPLGTEGPSVQLGTALGSGIHSFLPKKWRAWERFSMTGGASAGFAVATGAPLSGIFFSIEEAHGRISPLIILTAVAAVLFAQLTATVLSPLLGVEVALFDVGQLKVMPLEDYWLPLVAGIAMGLFALLFLKGYRALDTLLRKAWRAPQWLKIFLIFCATFGVGLLSRDSVSTGHHLVNHLFREAPSLFLLFLILILRSVLTLSANSVGITGGIFLPLLAIGSTFGVLVYRILLFCGLGEEYLTLFVVFGIAGCIAGMMKMPLTAVLFGTEALGLSANLLPLILVCIFAYAIPEALGEASVGEHALERRKGILRQGKTLSQEELEITVGENAFAAGKEIRDIFWPDGVRVLSVTKKVPGAHLLEAGDRLLIRLSTYDRPKALAELDHICR